MNKALALISILLIAGIAIAAGMGGNPIGSVAQYAVGAINPFKTSINMTGYNLTANFGTFSGNVTAANFIGNFTGTASINASDVLNPYWLNLTDQRYNETARIDSLNLTKAGLADNNNFTGTDNQFVNMTFYAWINPYNASTYCQWLNASCRVCVTGTVTETMC